MRNNIFLPKKIKVGFQNRNDTYTGKLAYITYYDEKNKLRKETSWENWRSKDIEPVEYDNTPISGFVLNKKVGGDRYGWNPRQTYTRVYDPRGFEFEITVPNLLYILENTNSIKGKGLEGDFVYGLDGKDLLLIPVEAPEYTELIKFNELVYKREFVKARELIIGATYRHINNNTMIYMGKFERFYTWKDEIESEGLQHFFYCNETLHTYKSIASKFIEIVNENCVENYAELFEKLECSREYSPYDKSKDEYVEYTLEEFVKAIDKRWYSVSFYTKTETGIVEYIESQTKEGKIRKRPSYNYFSPREEPPWVEIEEYFNRYKPMYRNLYLKNGKFYRSDK